MALVLKIFILMDGFFYINDTHDQRPEQWSTNLNMYWLLMQTKAPFLVCKYFDGSGGLNQFVLQKSDHKECLVPLIYMGVHRYDREEKGYQNASRAITRFSQTITTEHDAGLYDKKYWNAREDHLFAGQTHLKLLA